MNLPEIWGHLEDDYRSGLTTGRLQRRIVPASRRDFFLGLELPARNRMLVFRTSPISIAGAIPVPDSRGLVVRISNRETDPPTAEIELILTDQTQDDIFDLLIEDLVVAAEQAEDEKTAVGRFLARLADWQRLMMRLATRGLNRESQQGLWGELWTLRNVVNDAVGFADAVNGWLGPTGANQDFQLPGAALEVKTSTANTLDRIFIASESQLEAPSGISLALIALSLDARPGHGETLLDAVRHTRSLANTAGCRQLFDDRLDHSGYNDEDEETYVGIGYTIRSRVQFHVRGGFPRIVPVDLRDGVAEVAYSVSVLACAQFEVTETDLQDLLRNEL